MSKLIKKFLYNIFTFDFYGIEETGKCVYTKKESVEFLNRLIRSLFGKKENETPKEVEFLNEVLYQNHLELILFLKNVYESRNFKTKSILGIVWNEKEKRKMGIQIDVSYFSDRRFTFREYWKL
jgi:hypothetical protein